MVNQQEINMKKEMIVQFNDESKNSIIFYNINNILDVKINGSINKLSLYLAKRIDHLYDAYAHNYFKKSFKTTIFKKDKNNKFVCLIKHTDNVKKVLYYINLNKCK